MRRTFKTILLIQQFLIIILFSTCSQVDEKFTFQPRYPQPGQEISIAYNPSGTPLEDVTEITLLAYCYPEGTPVVQEVILKKSESAWKGSFSTSDTTLAIYLIFKSGEKIDDNNKYGYLISQYNAIKKPVKGGMARQAEVAFYGGTYPLRLQRDWDLAIEYYEKEFEFYPEQKQNWTLLNSYWYPLYNLYRETATAIIRNHLDKLDQKEDKTTTELYVLINWHQELKEKELAEKYEKELLERDPNGIHAEFDRYMECSRETSIDNKEQLIIAFLEDYPTSAYLEQLHDNMISAYTGKNLFTEGEVYIENYVKDPNSKLFDNLARPMIKKGIRLERAVELAEIAVSKARTEQKTERKPSNYTQQEWLEKQNRKLADVLDTYGFGLYKMGKVDESVPVFEEAVALSQPKNRGICQRYSRSLYESGQLDKAFTELELLVKANPKDEELNAFFKEVYIKNKGGEEGLEDFYMKANAEIRQKKLEEIKAQMIKKIAPAFTLNDLNGNSLRLADLKGKIVILDFWGTWCGVCLKSFPAMQQVVDKYKNDDNIKFLFIDTLEEIEEVEKKVKEIIHKNNYTFHVLLDEDNSVANAYKITAAPIKVIIDPNGNIRFIKEGYGGDDKLIEELDMMISMLR